MALSFCYAEWGALLKSCRTSHLSDRELLSQLKYSLYNNEKNTNIKTLRLSIENIRLLCSEPK